MAPSGYLERVWKTCGSAQRRKGEHMQGLLIFILIFWVLPFIIKKVKEKG